MPTDITADAPRPRVRWDFKHRGVLFICVLLVVSITGLVLKDGEPPPVVVLPPHVTLKYDPLPDRWIPASWGWLWRLRDFLRGKRAQVNLDARILKLSGPTLDLSHFPRPSLVTNNLMVWVLQAAECEGIGQILRSASGTTASESRPRMSTADGIVTALFSGGNVRMQGGIMDVGLTFQVLPKTSKRKTDLTFRVKLTELFDPEAGGRMPGQASLGSQPVLNTNVLESIRVQVPIGHGVVLVRPAVEGRTGCGMILSVDRK